MKKINKKRGFTLIELIIVIAIIAILAAIAVPAFGGISQKAKTNADLSNARTIYSVVTAGVAEGEISETVVFQNAAQLKNYGLAETPKPSSSDKEFFYSVTDGNVKIYISNSSATSATAADQVYPTSN